MHVSIDQARHEDPATAVDNLCVVWRVGRCGNNVFDNRTGDYNVMIHNEAIGVAIEDVRVAEDDAVGGWSLVAQAGGLSPFNVELPDDCMRNWCDQGKQIVSQLGRRPSLRG